VNKGHHRVVITGAGTLNPLGHSVTDTERALAAGHCAIGPLDLPDLDKLSIKIGAQVKGSIPEDHSGTSKPALCDRFTRFALFAAHQAVRQSGLSFSGDLALASGVILGSAAGGIQTADDSYRAVYRDGKTRVHPFTVPKLMHNAAASHIAMRHNLKGPGFTVATACASSNHAMGQAFHMVRAGLAPVMLTGGAEAMLTFGGLKAWEGLRVMSPDGCRPFCATRNGMVMGEGAAIFVFETLEHALARDAEILAEVCGFSMTSDAADIVRPDKNGAVRAMTGALADAGLRPEDIGYINAHGTGTAINDKTECAAIRDVFGDHADHLLVSSTKSMHGHLIGASGAVELLACIMALQDGIIAPTAGYREQDANCPLDVVPNRARHSAVRYTLSNAFAFGGANAVLVLEAYP
jgi:nodulation protein E